MRKEELLKKLKAKKHGRYYSCICPECGKREAYFFADEFKKAAKNPKNGILIHCNRESNCGKQTRITLSDAENLNEIEEETLDFRETLHMSQKGADKIKRLVSYQSKWGWESYSLPKWRGISVSTLKKAGVCFYDPDNTGKGFRRWIQTWQKEFDSCLNRDMYEKNIIIPINDYDGNILRLLLRTTHTEKNSDAGFRKEVNVPLTIGSSELWNRQSLLKEENYVFITEGVPDALSIQEVMPEACVTAITGVAKYSHYLREIESHPEITKKTVVICFDNDKAGLKYRKKFQEEMQKKGIKYRNLNLCGYKDCNDFLLKDKTRFLQELKKTLKKEKKLKTGKKKTVRPSKLYFSRCAARA